MNGVHVLTVKSAMRVDRNQISFFNDRNVSTHLHTFISNLCVVAYVIDGVSESYFASREAPGDYTALRI